MKSGLSMFFCLCGMLAYTTVGRANVSDTPASNAPAVANDQNQTDAAAPSEREPYTAIWERNVFNLTPKPPPPDTNAESNQPPSNVKLIGITTIFGKNALLSMQDAPERGKPQQGNKEEFLTMAEGERRGTLEVLEIHPENRTVKIKNDQIVSTLTFETNKAPAAMAGAPHPPMGGFGGGFQPHMGVPMNNGAPAPLPNRMMRSTPNSPSASAAQPNYGNLGATGYGGGYQPQSGGAAGVNMNSLFGQADTHQAPAQASSPYQTPEEQVAAMLLQHQAAAAAGQPIPPLPPMPNGVNPNEDNSGSSTGQNTGSPTVPPWLQGKTIPNFKPAAPPLP